MYNELEQGFDILNSQVTTVSSEQSSLKFLLLKLVMQEFGKELL